jgi:hypothetical protein
MLPQIFCRWELKNKIKCPEKESITVEVPVMSLNFQNFPLMIDMKMQLVY